ncbi:MAG: T9SS type A sorting domain-containing protein [Lewinella sp.]|nr:T9SS type A sorting domain-containing protein [Lewinella sp.]
MNKTTSHTNTHTTLVRTCIQFGLAGLLLLAFTAGAMAQTYVGNLVLRTQDDVDNFNFTVVTGQLYIGGSVVPPFSPSHITNLDGLSELQSVHNLRIDNNADLTNVDGLSGLQSAVGGISLVRNASLTNLDGLSGLQSVGPLDLNDNLVLANIDGLANLQSLGGQLQIVLNPELTNLDGLSSLESVAGRVYISENAALTNLDGLANLQTVGEQVTIQHHPSLTNVNGLEGLQSVGGGIGWVWIRYNAQLSDCCVLPELDNRPGISVILSQNATGCNYFSQIAAACVPVDADMDGYTEDEGDCDDDDASINPGATEICDGIDNNCDGQIDEGADEDCDGVADICDICPGGDDTVDHGGDPLTGGPDGIPDCSQLLPYAQYSADWQCGNNKLLITHVNGQGQMQTLCVNKHALPAHLAHGDWAGPYVACDQGRLAWPTTSTHTGALAEGEQAISLYPNPAQATVQLSFAREVGQGSIQLINVHGSVVRVTQVQDALLQRLEVSDLPEGIYMVRMELDGEFFAEQLVIQR